jgi:hypothetical protein
MDLADTNTSRRRRSPDRGDRKAYQRASCPQKSENSSVDILRSSSEEPDCPWARSVLLGSGEIPTSPKPSAALDFDPPARPGTCQVFGRSDFYCLLARLLAQTTGLAWATAGTPVGLFLPPLPFRSMHSPAPWPHDISTFPPA